MPRRENDVLQTKAKHARSASDAREARARRACRRWVILLVGVLLVMAVVGVFHFFTSSAFLKPIIHRALSKAVRGTVEIDDVELRSLRDFRMAGLRLMREGAEEPDIEVEKIRVDLNPWALLGMGVEARGGAVLGGKAMLSVKDGKTNFSELFAPKDPDRPPADQDKLARLLADGMVFNECEFSLRHPSIFKDTEPRRFTGLNGSWRRGANTLDWHHFEAEVSDPPLRGLRVQGAAKTGKDGGVRLRISGDTIRVTPELIAMLPSDLVSAVGQFDPQGWLGLESSVDLKRGQAPRFGLTLDLSGADLSLPLNSLPVQAARARLSVVREALNFSLDSGFLFSGNLQGTCAIRFPKNGSKPMRASVDFANVDLSELLAHMLPDDRSRPGRLDGTALVYGDLDHPEQLSIEGDVQLSDAILVELPVFASLFTVLNLRVDRSEIVRSGELDYHLDLEKGRFHIDGLELRSKNVQIGCRGWIGFDGTLDLIVVAALPDDTERGILAPLKRIYTVVVGGAQRLVTPPYSVTGTLENPKFRPMALEHIGAPLTSLFDILGRAVGAREE